MNYIARTIEKQIKEKLFKGKVIVIYGARQVGKTTLVKKILSEYEGKYLNCELFPVERGLGELDTDKIKAFLGDHKLIVLDEAQNIKEIGKILKIMNDTYPEMQIIATGSANFDLMQKVAEPMTGRNFTFKLYPFSLQEIYNSHDLFFVESRLENILRLGSYPEVFLLKEDDAKERLNEIASSYLFKDVLKFDNLKKSNIIRKLLELLALQLGQEISYQELGSQLGINRLTVEKYIDILEQCFVIFRLNAFSRNKRKEISKGLKIYFYDLGIRNSLIENYNKLDIRNDVGALFENLCIIEKMKRNEAEKQYANLYFWRTYDQQKVDLIEEKEGKLFAYEFKWKKNKVKVPELFLENYPEAEYFVINKENYYKFLLKTKK
ncbi:MAG: ATP-binding protein [Candidatus Pacebacteria bacterium]|nr:ATP-binding protein [Candidatus Paceibacterota bacterium]